MRPENRAPRSTSIQKRMLKMKLKLCRRTTVTSKSLLQMLHGLQKRIDVRAGGWRLFPAQARPHMIQLVLQLASQPVERFQRKGQTQFLHRRLHRAARQQDRQPLPQQRSGHGVAGQHVGQRHGKGAPTTAPLAAIGAKHPLPPLAFGRHGGRIIAVKLAVPVQCFRAAAMRAPRLLEGKSDLSNSGRSLTK